MPSEEPILHEAMLPSAGPRWLRSPSSEKYKLPKETHYETIPTGREPLRTCSVPDQDTGYPGQELVRLLWWETIEHEGDPKHDAKTILMGRLADQSALIGVLNSLYDIGYSILSVEYVKAGSCEAF